MDAFPDELCMQVVEQLDRDSLWNATRLSRRFRRLAALPFLAAAMPATAPKAGIEIPLERRSNVHRSDGTVSREALVANIRSSVA